MLSNFLLIFCAGYTFAVGGINVFIGVSNRRERGYLYFGLLSLFASIFLVSQIFPASVLVFNEFAQTISIITAAAFYGLFLWFIGEYTNYKNHTAQIFITVLVALVIPLFFLVKSSIVTWMVWEIFAHFTILTISIYGLFAGIKGLKEVSTVWKTVFLFMMGALFILTIIVGIGLSLDIYLIFDPEGFISPLDFFPVFFSILIGSKMGHDVLRSYQLDTEIKLKEGKWSDLMENINLLIIELDRSGKVTYVNSFFIKFSGYAMSEIIGKDWMQLMIDIDEKDHFDDSLGKIIDGQNIPMYQNDIRLKNGDTKSVQWSNFHLRNSEGMISGTISIGADVTERELSFAEIRGLKDQLEKENLLLKEEVKGQEYSSEIIGESDALMYVIKRTHQVSNTNSTVLLEGETGVGKELFANMIHQNSLRKHKPFVKVNCASLPKELIESELFGHEKGAFTGAIKMRQGRFELADKGTIFLDEIGELPLDLQSKLLRVLQSGEFERVGSEKTSKVDVRVVAATNRDLQSESSNGRFRQDLFFRLNVYPVTIPPLRQRKEDIPILIRHFTEKIGRKIGRRIKQISRADILKLQEYDWPGNVRELENVLERAIISSEGDTIKLDDDQLKSSLSPHIENEKLTSFSDSQKKHLIKVLEDCDWKINGPKGAAQKLGMPPSTLRSKMKKLNIVRQQNF